MHLNKLVSSYSVCPLPDAIDQIREHDPDEVEDVDEVRHHCNPRPGPLGRDGACLLARFVRAQASRELLGASSIVLGCEGPGIHSLPQ